VKQRLASPEKNTRTFSRYGVAPALAVMRSYLDASYRVMVGFSLLLGALLPLFRDRWPESFGALGPFPVLVALYAAMFLLIEWQSRRLMGRCIGWSGVGSPLFSVFILRAVLIFGCLGLVGPMLSALNPLLVMLGSLAVCVLIAAFFDSLRLLARIKVP
jgi:hypothetical protein